MKRFLQLSLSIGMLVLFTGISSFQSIHEWLHHHSHESHTDDSTCEWYSVKALPFVTPYEVHVIVSELAPVVVQHTTYKPSSSQYSCCDLCNRGPPSAGFPAR